MRARTRRRRRASWVQRDGRKDVVDRTPSLRRDPRRIGRSRLLAFRRQSASTYPSSTPLQRITRARPVLIQRARRFAPARIQCVPPPLMGFVAPSASRSQAASGEPRGSLVGQSPPVPFDGDPNPSSSSFPPRRAANPGPLRSLRFDASNAFLRLRSSETRRSAPIRSWGSKLKPHIRKPLRASRPRLVHQPDLHCYLQRLRRAA